MKFHGFIGYVISEEVSFGNFVDTPKEIEAGGDVETFRRRWGSEPQNSDLLFSNTILSVLETPSLIPHLAEIRYVKWRDSYWSVTNIEEVPPRIKITLGGVYRGQHA